MANEAIERLWAWWAERGADAFDEAIHGRGDLRALADEFSPYVEAVDDGLAWELGPGAKADHVLQITSGGIAGLRATAERVVAAAPKPTSVWEYASVRRRAANLDGMFFQGDGERLALDDMRVEAREDAERARVDTLVGHPSFATLPEKERIRVAYLALDWTLGEDDVERWLGVIEASDAAAPIGDDLASLRARVDAFAAAHSGTSWRILRGQDTDGSLVQTLAVFPLKWIDHLPKDRHIGVGFTYEAGDEGLPTPAELERLRALEDDLTDLLGTDAELVAVESSAGQRLLHYYADSSDDAVLGRATAWAETRAVDVYFEESVDPAWQAVERYR